MGCLRRARTLEAARGVNSTNSTRRASLLAWVLLGVVCLTVVPTAYANLVITPNFDSSITGNINVNGGVLDLGGTTNQATAGQITLIAKSLHRRCKSRAFPNRKDLPTLANRSSSRNRSRLLSGRPRPI